MDIMAKFIISLLFLLASWLSQIFDTCQDMK